MKTRELVKILAEESLDKNGAVDSARVSAVCEYVEANVPEHVKIPLLRGYMRVLKPVLKRGEVLVETSGKLSETALADIEKFVSEATGRQALKLREIENKKLLGGVKITCGDDIWERSAASALESLRAKTNNNI